MTVTADGRDLTTVEWRTIPEFPKYQITRDGDVRNTRTGRLVNEHHNQTTGAWAYTLRKTMPNGSDKNYTRNYAGLVKQTWPEDAA